MLALLSLFSVSFLAATVLPLSSEALFLALLAGESSLGSLLLAATLGNTLGACVNWWLGTALRTNLPASRLFTHAASNLESAERWFNRAGKWSLLLAWLPIIGDALTVFAGVVRVPLWQLALLAGVGKFARYCALAGLFAALMPALGL